MHVCVRACMHTQMHMHMHTHMHAHTHMHTYTHTYTCVHTHTHTHTHLHAHTHILSTFKQQRYCFALNLSSPGTSMLVCSFPMKSRRRLACGVLDTVPCSWCHKHTLLDTKWQCSWPYFCDFQISIFDRLEGKLTEKVVCLFFDSVAINRARYTSSHLVPFGSMERVRTRVVVVVVRELPFRVVSVVCVRSSGQGSEVRTTPYHFHSEF